MKTYLKYSGTNSCLVELKDLITMKLTNIKKNSISHVDVYIYFVFFFGFLFLSLMCFIGFLHYNGLQKQSPISLNLL